MDYKKIVQELQFERERLEMKLDAVAAAIEGLTALKSPEAVKPKATKTVAKQPLHITKVSDPYHIPESLLEPDGPDWSLIRQEYEAGASVKHLSDRFGVPTTTIHSRKRRENWKRTGEKVRKPAKRPLIQNWPQIRQEYETTDESVSSIAKRHGCSDQGIKYHVDKEGWKRDKQAKNRPKVLKSAIACPSCGAKTFTDPCAVCKKALSALPGLSAGQAGSG